MRNLGSARTLVRAALRTVGAILLVSAGLHPCAIAHAEEFDYDLGMGLDYFEPSVEVVSMDETFEAPDVMPQEVTATDYVYYVEPAQGAAQPGAIADFEWMRTPENIAALYDHLKDAAAPTLKEAQGAAIIDGAGNILYEKDAERPMSPASTTKVMTAVVALDSLKNGKSLDDRVKLVEPYLGPDAQMADFTEGETAIFRDLLRVMLVYSANDAAYNVALHVAGSIEGFADLMNAKAAEIGLTHSHFMNPHGIDEDGHFVCAIDLARLSRYAMQNYPFIAQTVCSEQVEIPLHGEQAVFQSTDALLGTYRGMRGVKTGYAENFTFMGASGRGNVSLYTAVLGCVTAAGRFNDTAAMMDWAYAKLDSWQIAEDRWAVRVNPYALDFEYQTILSAKDDARGTMWPGGGSLTFTSAIARPGRLLDANKAYGWSRWLQSGRGMGEAHYVTRGIPVRVSAWPTFSLPLFTDASNVGRPSTDA